MSADDPLLDATRAIVDRVAGPSRAPAGAGAGADTRLAEGYWLDSIELLEVLIACEAEFGVVFDERRDLDDGTFETLGSLTRMIRTKNPTLRSSP
jgi:acyl carrier protein